MTEIRCNPALFLFLLVAITMLGPLAMQIIVPAIPVIGRDLNSAPATAQLVLSLSMISIAFANLVYGPLSDLFGRRPVLLSGLALYIAASWFCVVAPTIGLLIVGRVLQAAGATSGMVLSRAIIRDVYGRSESARMIAYVTVGMVAAPMAAPALGGALTEAVGWRLNFAVAGTVGAAIGALILAKLWETHPTLADGPAQRLKPIPMLNDFAALFSIRSFRGYALQTAFTMASFFCFVGGAPFVMVETLGRPADEYGYYFIMVAGGFMAGNLTSARIVGRVGLDRMIVLGSILSLIGVAVSIGLFAAGIWEPICIFAPGCVISFGNGLSMPNAQAGAVSVDPGIAGAASGLTGFLQMFLASGFAQLTALLFDGTPWPMLILMGLTVFAALVGFVLQRDPESERAIKPAD